LTITGSGTQADPYILYTGEDFEQLKLSLSAYFNLNNDVDFNGLLYTPPLDFGGVFDGNGKKIKNLTTGNGSNYSSLFGRTTSMLV
jgi:hypothetical protein